MDDIKNKAVEFIKDRKNSNNLLDLLKCLEARDVKVVLAAIRAIHKVCMHIISSGELQESVRIVKPETATESANKEDVYQVWIKERFSDCCRLLCDRLVHKNSAVQELALCTLMRIVKTEGELKSQENSKFTFPVQLLKQIVQKLLLAKEDSSAIIERFQEFTQYDDVRYFTMKCALQVIKASNNPADRTTMNNENACVLLQNLTMPDNSDDLLSNFYLNALAQADDAPKVCLRKEHRLSYQNVWLEYLKSKLHKSLYHKVLVILHDKVMPYMTNPLLLSDFLVESYAIGGVTSLLALNGLFVLIHGYNLPVGVWQIDAQLRRFKLQVNSSTESIFNRRIKAGVYVLSHLASVDFPDFYPQLYALVEPSVFHVKYRARFFFLLDLFLTSTHLPAYLVAAFVKRLARISLTAPADGLLIVIPLIFNLIRRHDACLTLLHRPNSAELSSDPYDASEPDPAKCHALESSLWELKSLTEHYHHSVAAEAKKMESSLGKQETDLSDLLNITADDLMAKEKKKKLSEVPISYDKPSGLFSAKDSLVNKLWLIK